MKTEELLQKGVWSFDIECFHEIYLIGGKNVATGEWRWFEVSKYKNQIDGAVKWLSELPGYLAGFNSISYDSQVTQFVLDNHKNWWDKTGLEICEEIYRFSNDLIDSQNYDNRTLPYRMKYMDNRHIDLGTVHNCFNEQKKTSLKWIEFMTDQVVDELPFDHTKTDLTEDECRQVVEYWKNDINATEILWNYTIGNCDHPLYKGKDKIQERLDAMEEFKLSDEALSYSDVKLGETVNLNGYMQLTGKKMNELYEAKKNRKKRDFTFGECIPKWVKFKTPEMRAIREKVDKVKVKMSGEDKQEFPFMFRGLEYRVARGGIHSENSAVLLQEDDQYDLEEFDASSQYPCAIVRRGLYPAQLGKEWLINYKRLIEKRLESKKLGKTDTKHKGLAETLKISINGGGFGKTNDPSSVQYDPFVQFQCTIGNQFEILMLIEWLSEEGIEVLMANTDGALCRIPKAKKDRFYQICKKWEDTVGITEAGIGELEYTRYTKFVMLNVNSYLAIKPDGSTKEKKDLKMQHLINENKSNKMVAVGLYNYLMTGKTPEETMKEHRNIYDFCRAVKANRDYYYRYVEKKSGKTEELNKLVRFYCSNTDGKLFKLKKKGGEAKRKAESSAIEKTAKGLTLFVTPFTPDSWEGYKVDTGWYAEKCWEVIKKVMPVEHRDRREKLSGQISLF